MEFIPAYLEGLYTIRLRKLEDERGWFARTFCKNEFRQIGFDKEFVQFNHSFNKHKGTIRGMHFQNAPYMETKLIRCIQGSVYDVAVDLRKESPTFLQIFWNRVNRRKYVKYFNTGRLCTWVSNT